MILLKDMLCYGLVFDLIRIWLKTLSIDTFDSSKPVCYSTMESKQALLRSLQEEEGSLLEQERNLKLKHEQLRKALAEASSNIEEGTACHNL